MKQCQQSRCQRGHVSAISFTTRARCQRIVFTTVQGQDVSFVIDNADIDGKFWWHHANFEGKIKLKNYFGVSTYPDTKFENLKMAWELWTRNIETCNQILYCVFEKFLSTSKHISCRPDCREFHQLWISGRLFVRVFTLKEHL